MGLFDAIAPLIPVVAGAAGTSFGGPIGGLLATALSQRFLQQIQPAITAGAAASLTPSVPSVTVPLEPGVGLPGLPFAPVSPTLAQIPQAGVFGPVTRAVRGFGTGAAVPSLADDRIAGLIGATPGLTGAARVLGGARGTRQPLRLTGTPLPLTARRLGPIDDIGGRVGMAGSFRQTVVQTIERGTNVVIRQEVRSGAPFLMNRDIVIAKRVFRLATKLHGRLPRRAVKRRSGAGLAAFSEFIQGQRIQGALCPPREK